MAAEDLSSISGLEDKHRRALARRQITTLRGLADADRDVIYRAMGSIKPRPTHDQIARWQGEAAVETMGWHRVASFVVIFAQRRSGDVWERWIEAERTEVEPEREREIWPGWECKPICGWMQDQLGQASGAEPGASDQGGSDQEQAVGAPAGPARPRRIRTSLRIDSAAIIDAAGRTDLVTEGALVASPPAGLTTPARVVFTVSGARPGTEVQALARLRGHGEPGRNVADPVALPPSGRAEFDLSRVTADQLEMDLLAWAPDATARPASVRLPTMRIGPGTV